MNKIHGLLHAAVVAFASSSLFAAVPRATFTGDALIHGSTIDGVTLDLNGNAFTNGAVVIGSKPVLVKGLTGRAASVVVKYADEIEATVFAIASASSEGDVDVTGVWTDGARLTGIWKGGSWANVEKTSALYSENDCEHTFCFAYSADTGTRLYLDGVRKYDASPLKSVTCPPTMIAVGGAARPDQVKGAAEGLKILSIKVYSSVLDEKDLLAVRPSGTAYVAEALRPYLESGELPGAVSILYKDGVEEVGEHGFADVAAKRRISLDSTFMQCSQTKGFCGVVLARLVEDGRLSLEDPVSKYLPEFKTLWVDGGTQGDVRTLKKAKNVLTVKMCLNHTGGFPFEIAPKGAFYRGGGWTRGAPLRSTAVIAATSPLCFEPGTSTRYSNTGIDIAAAVAEVVTGKSFEELLKEIVLDPLGMTETTFNPTDEQLARKIELYACASGQPAQWLEENMQQQRPYNGSGVFASAGAGLWTTARDQVKFYKMLMNLGRGENGVRVLNPETVKSLLAVSSRGDWAGGYSLGLVAPAVDTEEGWFGHGGAFRTNCMVNYHKRELVMWVVQQVCRRGPWDDAYDKAAERFLSEKHDSSSAEAYTGRTE